MSMSEREITTEIPDPIRQVFDFLVGNGELHPTYASEEYNPIIKIREGRLFCEHPCRIDSFSKLECGEGMYIGKYVHIASFTHLGIGGGLLILEQGSSCASGVKIITGSNQPGEGHGCSAIDPKAIIKRSFVHVKRNATLYTNVVVCPGVTVGEGAVVLPGAVVNKDVPDGETWGGVPAKRITKSSDKSLSQVEIEEYLMKEFGKLPRFTEKLMQSEKTCPACSTRMDLGSMQCGYCGKAVTLEVSVKDRSAKSIGEQSLDMWTAAQAEMYCWDDDDKNIG